MEETQKPSGVEIRWPGKLGHSFTPVSQVFLRNHAKLTGPRPGAPPLNSTEFLVVIQLLSFHWTASKQPHPAVGTIAKRMGLSTRAVRQALSKLEAYGYVQREPRRNGGTNKYHFGGLYKALEELMDRESKEAS